MTRLLLATAVLLTGCPKSPPAPATPDWEATPRLPAPMAGVYARSAETPTDEPLADFVKGLPWDAALSGAAAGLALEIVTGPDEVGLTRWRVREKLWNAGYPFPVTDARAWTAMPDGGPPPQLVTWLDGFPDDEDLGLVRARGDEQDYWIALRAEPGIDFGRVPRQVPEGGTYTIPAREGGTYRVADANGRLLEGSLEKPATIEFNSQGEWVLEVRGPSGPPALFPVYVGMVPPELALIRDVAPVQTPEDALDRAESLLQDIRDVYGAPALKRDFVLDAGARSLLRGDAESPDAVRAALELDPEATMVWECEGSTVEACIDRVVWAPENRLALLHDDSGLGLAAKVQASGVHLVGIVSVTH